MSGLPVSLTLVKLTDPDESVSAGMIFVSMENEDNELLRRTENFRVSYELVDEGEDSKDDSYEVNFLESTSDPTDLDDWSPDDTDNSPEPARVESLEPSLAPSATFNRHPDDRKRKCVLNFEPAMYVGAP